MSYEEVGGGGLVSCDPTPFGSAAGDGSNCCLLTEGRPYGGRFWCVCSGVLSDGFFRSVKHVSINKLLFLSLVPVSMFR